MDCIVKTKIYNKLLNSFNRLVLTTIFLEINLLIQMCFMKNDDEWKSIFCRTHNWWCNCLLGLLFTILALNLIQEPSGYQAI